MKKIRVITVFVLLSIALPLAAQEVEDRFTIRLGETSIRPETGDMNAEALSAKVFIMQFTNLPDAESRAAMAGAGIQVLRYLGANAYLVRRTVEAGPTALPAAGVRAVIPFIAEMKRSPLLNKDPALHAAVASGEPMLLSIRFLPGVERSSALAALNSAGLNIAADRFEGTNAIVVRESWEVVSKLLDADTVEWVEPTVLRKKSMNDVSSSRIRVEMVRQKSDFRNASGSAIPIALWDGGMVDSHPDFEDRVTIIEEDRGLSSHATHVAGTMAGAGILDSSAMGMAPDAQVYSYDFFEDEVAEMRSASERFNILVSNNSWGGVIGWDPDTDDSGNLIYKWYGDQFFFGAYGNNSRALDQLTLDEDVLILFAAGNSRGDFQLGDHFHGNGTTVFTDFHPNNPIYGSIGSRSSAKNVVCVGATMKDDYVTAFSGWGPTDDGRIKPDVVANGYRLRSTDLNNSYGSKSGTSMATPSASGAATLLADYYQRRHGSRIASDMLKNLLIHSARDIGRPGPDYENGHGIVDAELGARIIKKAVFDTVDFPAEPAAKRDQDKAIDAMMLTGTLSNGNKKRHRFTIPEGIAEMRVSLVWHDAPGEGLINDLDMWVKIRGQGKFKPFLLDPANPTANATTGTNRIDNIESIRVANPKAGKVKITVRGTRVPLGPQRYTLIISTSDGNHSPAIVSDGSFRTHDLFPSLSTDFDNLTPKTTLVQGDEFYFYVRFFVDENSNFGEYFGSVSSFWRILDASGNEVFGSHLSSSNMVAREKFWRWRLGQYKIANNLTPGNYTIEVVLTMHNGFTRTITSPFSVQ